MTVQLSPGQNAPLGAARVLLEVATAGSVVDCSGLLVAATGKVRSDDDMVFYGQPSGPGVTHRPAAGAAPDGIAVDTEAVPAEVEKVVVTASLDGTGPATFGAAGRIAVTVRDAASGAALAEFVPTGLGPETALVCVEVYRRGGDWKVRAVGQGYANGLAGIATDFGVSVEGEPAAAAAAPPPPPVVSLEKKRLVDLEKKLSTEAPAMLSLVKAAGVSLTKRGLSEHTAKVALVIDISGSMGSMFRKGAVQRLCERVLALGLRFDDDGALDVFLFGKNVHQPEPMTLPNHAQYIAGISARYRLEGDTRYGAAMEAVRKHYFGGAGKRTEPLSAATPVYCMFLTDGTTSDKPKAERNVRESSYEPLFWQFMAIGKPGQFDFLEKLDDMTGRHVDNADFFSVTPDELLGNRPISDDALFDRLMQEYPGWITKAQAAGLLR